LLVATGVCEAQLLLNATPARQSFQPSDQPIEPTSTPDIVIVIVNAVQRLFGSR